MIGRQFPQTSPGGLMTEIVPLEYGKLSYRPLFLDYVRRYQALSELFAGDPFGSESWSTIAREVGAAVHPRAAVSRDLVELNGQLGADAAALSSIEALDSGALAVVTGQQVGILGGPLYTLYKALSAVRLARSASALLGRTVVPLFWMDTDDHDFEEIAQAHLLNASGELVSVRYEPENRGSRVPVGQLRLDPAIEKVIEAASRALPQSEFQEELRASFEAYAPGRTLAEAFGSFLLRLTRGTGLVIVDPSRPALKRLAIDLFRREIETGRESHEKVRASTQKLVAAGYHAQVTPVDSQLNPTPRRASPSTPASCCPRAW